MKTTKEEVESFIRKLEWEADEMSDRGYNFSASNMQNEAERLQKLLDRGIIPQAIN